MDLVPLAIQDDSEVLVVRSLWDLFQIQLGYYNEEEITQGFLFSFFVVWLCGGFLGFF